jgi:hypothetical protein
VVFDANRASLNRKHPTDPSINHAILDSQAYTAYPNRFLTSKSDAYSTDWPTSIGIMHDMVGSAEVHQKTDKLIELKHKPRTK